MSPAAAGASREPGLRLLTHFLWCSTFRPERGTPGHDRNRAKVGQLRVAAALTLVKSR